MNYKEIILGTVQFGLQYGINNHSGRINETEVFELLDKAYNEGIRKLDTAEAYGNAEDIIGKYHRQVKHRFGINTKFANRQKEELLSVVKTTLAKMSIEKIQTYFFHSYADYITTPGFTNALADLKNKDQLIESIGLSVYTNEEFETAIFDPLIDVIQLPFNLLDNFTRRGNLLRKAKMAKKQIQVRSVFLQGLFFKDISSLPVYLLPLKPYLERLHTFVDELEVSMETLCLQYVNSQPEIDEIIIGVDDKAHLLRNLQSLKYPVNETLCNSIDQIQVIETDLLYPYNWK